MLVFIMAAGERVGRHPADQFLSNVFDDAPGQRNDLTSSQLAVCSCSCWSPFLHVFVLH